MATISEQMIMKCILNKYHTLFRNNVGTAITKTGGFIKFGLCPGSSDLIGWETIEITQDMVGQKIARFLSVEVKNKTGALSQEQTKWLEKVNESGGRGIVARSVKDI
jgi:hypothetical protein